MNILIDFSNPDFWQLLISQGLFAVLFVWLLYDTRQESKEREERLMTQLEKSEDSHIAILGALEKLTAKLDGGN